MSGQFDSGLVGTQADMVARMRAVLPPSWFPVTPPGAAASEAPVLEALLSGVGWAWSHCYQLISYISIQARIATATGGFLDMISADLFGLVIKRQPNEGDDAFRSRIRTNLLLRRATRAALSDALQTLTGRAPLLFEPTRASDTGGYGSALNALAGGGGGYGSSALGYGSTMMPFQYLMTVLMTGSWTSRGSIASYIDCNGAMQIAAPRVVRPLYLGGLNQGPLSEDRGFNLIKDSVGWSECLPAESASACRWTVDPAGNGALWAGQPVLRVGMTESGVVVGPTMSVVAGTGPVTGSIWILVPAGQNFATLNLKIVELDGAGDLAEKPIDLTLVGQWQRVAVSLPMPGQVGRRVSLTLTGISAGVMSSILLTQCWQIEPGLFETSYIPSQTQIGIRDADALHVLDTLPSSVIDLAGLEQAVGRAIPAGSVPWMTVIS